MMPSMNINILLCLISQLHFSKVVASKGHLRKSRDGFED